MSWDAGSITSKLSIDSAAYAGGMKSAMASAVDFSTTSTRVLQQATDQQRRILASVRGTDAFGEGSIAAIHLTQYRRTALDNRTPRILNLQVPPVTTRRATVSAVCAPAGPGACPSRWRRRSACRHNEAACRACRERPPTSICRSRSDRRMPTPFRWRSLPMRGAGSGR